LSKSHSGLENFLQQLFKDRVDEYSSYLDKFEKDHGFGLKPEIRDLNTMLDELNKQ
jgi:hypothetical protein